MQGLVGEDEAAEVDPEALGLVKNLGFLHRATGNRGKVLHWGRAVIHLFADMPNMRHAVNRIDTVTFEFLRDHTWVAGRGVLRLTHTHTHTHTYTHTHRGTHRALWCFSKFSNICHLKETYWKHPGLSFKYLLFIWLVSVMAHGIFSCGMWDLVP